MSGEGERAVRDAAVGLCSSCRFAAVQESARGGRFWRCTRAEREPGFPRYPPLPVLRCAGFQRSRASGGPPPPDQRSGSG